MTGGRIAGAVRPWSDIWSRSGWTVQAHIMTGQARTLDLNGKLRASGSEAACLSYAELSAPPSRARRAVVLLHGLANYPGETARAARAFQHNGWAVANTGYPSLRAPIARHAESASRVARSLADGGAETVSFFGHSLGGLVARAAMARAAADGWRPGRLLLVGSPAQGSAIARLAVRSRALRALGGECVDAVTPAGAGAIPLPVCQDTMIIAGGTGGRGYNPLLRGDNDGVVTVDETRLPGHEADFLLVRALHTSLPSRPETIAAALRFLDAGR